MTALFLLQYAIRDCKALSNIMLGKAIDVVILLFTRSSEAVASHYKQNSGFVCCKSEYILLGGNNDESKI